MKTKDARSLSPDAQEDLRRRAVEAVRRGMSKSEAARVFGVSRQSMVAWTDAWRRGGDAALAARRRGRPPGGTLTRAEEARIARLVVDRHPNQLKLPFWLWTRAAVGELIERRCGVSLSVWTVGRLLRKWGFTPQKPVRRAFERDPAAVRRWLRREYPAIRAKARREGARILWGDEMGLRSDHQTGTSWSLRGRTPVVPGTGRRFRCNVVSAVDNRGGLAFMVFRGRFNARVMIDFLRRLERQAAAKVLLILDRHAVHTSRAVRTWLERRRGRIELFFLPAYSPELNPDELLNNDVKSNALGRRRPRDQEEMIADVRSFLWATQKSPHIVENYFREEHVRYAAQ